MAATGDQEAALSAVALVELSHGLTAPTRRAVRARREAFIHELLGGYSGAIRSGAVDCLAGREIDGEQQSKGIKIPFQDLLIGVTGLHLGYTVVTGNPRHFQMIPNLVVQQL